MMLLRYNKKTIQQIWHVFNKNKFNNFRIFNTNKKKKQMEIIR